ncbi:thioredoxin-like protein [Xylogone sp. PMI_703]|nr:thioredoxin-like protein [Xylogone sp. PMI_703]
MASQTSVPSEPSSLHLYDYKGSPCTARVRKACALKGITLRTTIIDLFSAEQDTSEFRSLNPNGLVPVLVASYPDGRPDLIITQSVSILEFLEESYVGRRRLLPGIDDLAGRYRVRDLVLLLCADLQPLVNKRVRDLVEEMGGDLDKYMNTNFYRVMDAYEKVVSVNEGRFSVGDEVTLADVCLVPMAGFAAHQTGSLTRWPKVEAIVKACKEMEEFSA